MKEEKGKSGRENEVLDDKKMPSPIRTKPLAKRGNLRPWDPGGGEKGEKDLLLQ